MGGVQPLPQVYFPTVGESLRKLAPNITKILRPGLEQEEEQRRLRRELLMNPETLQTSANMVRSNPDLVPEYNQFFGEDFGEVLQNVPPDFSSKMQNLYMETFEGLDPEQKTKLGLQGLGLGESPQGVLEGMLLERGVELYENLRSGELDESNLSPTDIATLGFLGIDIEGPETGEEEQEVPDSAIMQVIERLIDPSIGRPDLAKWERVRDWYADPSSDPELTEVLGIAPTESEGEESDIVSARRLFNMGTELGYNYPLEEYLAYVKDPSRSPTIARVVEEHANMRRERDRREKREDHARILAGASSQIRMILSNTQLNRSQQESSIETLINTTINPILGMIGADLGVDGLHAELDTKGRWYGIGDFLRGIKVIDAEGNEFDYEQIQNYGTLPGRGFLSGPALDTLAQLEQVPPDRREEAINYIRRESPRIYQELIDTGYITP